MTDEKKILESLEEIKELLRTLLENNKEFKEEETLEVKVNNIFKELGIHSHLKGYDYATTAIILCMESPNLLQRYSITKILYPTIAKKYETTPSKVERAIRYIIQMCFTYSNEEYLKKIFGPVVSLILLNEVKRPTNTNFISAIIDFIKFNS